jgi:mannose-6-phosphate isomerase-like protein (cupin superfamily)
MRMIEPADMIRGKPLRGWSGSFFQSDNMTFGIWEITADAAPLHEHHHPQEEVWNVVAGEIALTVDGEERVARAGCAVVIPPNARHSARPLGPCRAIVVDWPVRDSLPGVTVNSSG